MKEFFSLIADNFKFILEGKGIKEKALRLWSFIFTFIVSTIMILSVKNKKPPR